MTSQRQPPAYPPASKAELKRLLALTTKKGRDEASAFLAEGWKTVHEALLSSCNVTRVIADPSRVTADNVGILDEARRRHVPVLSLTTTELNQLCDAVHAQGIVAAVDQPNVRMQEVLSVAGHILILDAIADPGNLGTLIRTADWFGFGGIILGPGSVSPFNEKVVRSTSGSLFHVPTLPVRDLALAIGEIRASGRTIIAADVGGGVHPRRLPRTPLALVLGSEAHGIARDIRQLVDLSVSIPSFGHAESLNVAIAGAVLMSAIAEQTLTPSV